MSDPETWTISGPSAANAKLVPLHIGQARRRPDRAAYTNGGKGSNEYVSIYLNISSPAQTGPEGRFPARKHGGGRGYNLEVYYIYTPPDAKARWRQRRSLFRLKFKYYLLQFHAGFWPIWPNSVRPLFPAPPAPPEQGPASQPYVHSLLTIFGRPKKKTPDA